MHSEEGGRIRVWQQQLKVPVSLRGCGSLKHSLPSLLIRFKEYGTSARWQEVCGALSAGVRRTHPRAGLLPTQGHLDFVFDSGVPLCEEVLSPQALAAGPEHLPLPGKLVTCFCHL